MSSKLKQSAVFLGGALVLLLLATAASTDGFKSFGGSLSGERLERAKRSPFYRDGRFHNERETTVMKPGSMWGAASAWFSGKEMRSPNCPLPLADPKAALQKAPESELRLTWFGHSTVLVEIDGHKLLTDAHFSERASPSTWVGPKRFHAPPLALDALPELDAVLISHDHYDHLDMATVKALAKKTRRFLVSLGVGAHLEAWGIDPKQVVELEWWQQESLGTGLIVAATPAQHFSGRLLSQDLTQWASWTIVGPKHRVFFSGDTGLGPHFEAIAKRFGPIDVSMLEIGQYNERWGDIHLGPQGAIEAHRLLGASKLLPIHWGTFELGYHSWSGPAEELFDAAGKQGVALLTPKLGEPIEPAKVEASHAWWRSLPPTAPACP